MGSDREAEARDEMQAILAKLKVLECALLEVLQGFDRDMAASIGAGLRAGQRVVPAGGVRLHAPRGRDGESAAGHLLGALDDTPRVAEDACPQGS